MYEKIEINDETEELINKTEEEIKPIFEQIENIAKYNSLKVLNAFQKYRLSELHFTSTTGYGYDDIGRECVENIFAEVLGGEDALVRTQIVSGTHALTIALFAFLRPNDTMLSIAGKPYDTLDTVIGIEENASSLKSFGIKYEQIDLQDNKFDTEKYHVVLTTQPIFTERYSRQFFKSLTWNMILLIDNQKNSIQSLTNFSYYGINININ